MSDLRSGTLRLGDILVNQGVLTPQQRDEVLEEQRLGGRPFGELAEWMFGINPEAVERAWAEQVATLTERVDPRLVEVDPYALRQVGRRQAWQFAVLPLCFDGEELVVCTTKERLTRALRFVGWKIGAISRIVLAEPLSLGEAMERYYPLAGMRATQFCGSDTGTRVAG
jgi:hypothetical protein